MPDNTTEVLLHVYRKMGVYVEPSGLHWHTTFIASQPQYLEVFQSLMQATAPIVVKYVQVVVSKYERAGLFYGFSNGLVVDRGQSLRVFRKKSDVEKRWPIDG